MSERNDHYRCAQKITPQSTTATIIIIIITAVTIHTRIHCVVIIVGKKEEENIFFLPIQMPFSCMFWSFCMSIMFPPQENKSSTIFNNH